MNDDYRRFLAENQSNYKSAKELHAALLATFEGAAVSYATVTRELRKPLWTPSKASDDSPVGRPADKQFHDAVARLLEEDPTLSARRIAWILNRDHSSVCWVLKHVLGLEFKKTRWIPHNMTQADRDRRVRDSEALLDTLARAEKDSFRFLVTGDETWFFYTSPHNGLWLPPEAEAPTFPRPSHYAPKTMITVFWGIRGVEIILALPADKRWDGDYFADTVVSEIAASELYQKARKQKQRYVLHMDNAPPHRARIVKEELKAAGITLAPHPAYSPDLAPSDFFLFGYLKERARGIEFEDSGAICEWIREQFDEMRPEMLRSVFKEWQRRLRECIAKHGAYLY